MINLLKSFKEGWTMVWDTKKSTLVADENGSYHMVKCTGDGCERNGCIVWSKMWLPERIPKGFLARPLLCGLWPHNKISETSSQAGAPVLEGKQVSRLMQFSNMGGKTRWGLLGWMMEATTKIHTRKWSLWQSTVGKAWKESTSVNVIGSFRERAVSGLSLLVLFEKRRKWNWCGKNSCNLNRLKFISIMMWHHCVWEYCFLWAEILHQIWPILD